ncbi:transcriptional regulator [Marivivens niveibacter]|uniref:Transcriptional regulator n=1 Tax=Marivivens niveibacter TaxID=1930667 RepID=A0A251WVE5_9RHOB|nr:sugar-binding domain-containing protein [Marivivens niveibacter]OUD08125.1 transcriptional regulator [Marivivens niveibacter]
MAEPDRAGSRLPIEDAAREQLMVRIARMAFLEDATQTEIARATGLNRWQVSRLLAEARETGIVQIRIVPKSGRHPDLEYQLKQAFGLTDVVIVSEGVPDAAGRYLATLNPKTLGVSWGRTMSAVADALPNDWADGVEVVQINGTVPPIPQEKHHNDVAASFAVKGAGHFVPLPVPAIVGASETRRVLESDRIVSRVIDQARQAQYLVFSLGAAVGSALLKSGNIETTEYDALIASGAVGDVLGRFVDRDGAIVDPELDLRTIGLEFDDLRQSQTVAIAHGEGKKNIVLAALRAGVIKTLITDADTAAFVLEHKDDN